MTTSATGAPTLVGGPSGSPVTPMIPERAWARRSKDGRSATGPPSVAGVTLTHTHSGFAARRRSMPSERDLTRQVVLHHGVGEAHQLGHAREVRRIAQIGHHVATVAIDGEVIGRVVTES